MSDKIYLTRAQLAEISTDHNTITQFEKLFASVGVLVDEEDEESNFTGLKDTPSDYLGQGGKIVKVNETEDGLEFTESVTVERVVVKELIAETHYTGAGILTSDNQIITWGTKSGSDIAGGLFDGMQDDDLKTNPGFVVPPPVGELGTIVKVKMWAHGGFVLYDSNNLYGAGYNGFGWLGQGNTASLNKLELLATGVTDFVTPEKISYHHNEIRTFIKKDGEWYGAGYNSQGGLGLSNTTSPINTFTRLQWSVGDLIDATTVKNIWDFGGRYGSTWIEKTGGTLWVCGYNGHGQFGTGVSASANSTFTEVGQYWLDAGDTIISISGGFGYYGTAAVSNSVVLMLIEKSNGDRVVKGAGSNSHYQLADGTTTIRKSPILIAGLPTNIKDFKCMGGLTSSYVLTDDNNLWVWGYGAYGQMGDGTGNPGKVVKKLTTKPVEKIFAITNSHTYAYRSTFFCTFTDGTLASCGRNNRGQAGDGTNADKLTLAEIPYNHQKYGKIVDVKGNGNNDEFWSILLTETGDLFGTGYNGDYCLNLGTGRNATNRSMLQKLAYRSLVD